MSDFQDLFSLLHANDFETKFEEITHDKEYLKAAYRRLTKIYKQNRHAEAVLNWFAVNLDETDHLVQVTDLENNIKIGPGDRPRGAIIHFLKQLDEWKWGEFKTGRRGGVSRFISSYSLKEIGRLAAYTPHVDVPSCHEGKTYADAGDAQGANGEAGSHETIIMAPRLPETFRYRFRLRPDFPIEIDLPLNLTSTEANRFADFIKSLPCN